jgi:hypothetical protein
MTKKELISKLNTSISEFAFIPVSKVIELVNSLEETTPASEGLEETISKVMTIVSDCVDDVVWDDYVEKENAHLSLSGNYIYVDEVEFNHYNFRRDFMKNVKECFDELKPQED